MVAAKLRKNDKRIKTFVQEITSSLALGKKYQVPGLGTFTTCSRKDSSGRVTCKIAMFRPSAELRDYASGGVCPSVSGQYEDAIRYIIEAMKNEEGVQIPRLGRLAVIPAKGKKPKLIFHGADELNNAL